jgi:hypothetical protein
MSALRREGYTITFDWVEENKEEEDATFDKLAQLTVKPIEGAVTADVCILLMAKGMGGRGSFVDLGAAISHNKPVIVIEYDEVLEHFFVNNPAVMRVRSIIGMLYWLRHLRCSLGLEKIED